MITNILKLAEKHFEFVLGDWNQAIYLELPLILLLMEVDLIPKKKVANKIRFGLFTLAVAK